MIYFVWLMLVVRIIAVFCMTLSAYRSMCREEISKTIYWCTWLLILTRG